MIWGHGDTDGLERRRELSKPLEFIETPPEETRRKETDGRLHGLLAFYGLGDSDRGDADATQSYDDIYVGPKSAITREKS